jgi:hypothetical protein
VAAMLRARVALGGEAVFHELPLDRFGDRSRQLSQRMGHRLRHDLGIVDPALASAHSWRHRARTLMEGAGIPPWTSDWIMGHQRGGEGLSRYSKPSDQQLIEAVKAVPLPTAP